LVLFLPQPTVRTLRLLSCHRSVAPSQRPSHELGTWQTSQWFATKCNCSHRVGSSNRRKSGSGGKRFGVKTLQ
jgi:hypothetical protein